DVEALLAHSERFGISTPIAGDAMLSAADPEAHAVARRLLGARLNPDRLQKITAELDALAGRLLLREHERSPFDVVEEFARPLADYIGARVLGLEPASARSMTAAGDSLLREPSARLQAGARTEALY